MVNINKQGLTSFFLASIGIMTTMTFGFVPLINLFESINFSILALTLFWLPFGLSCFLAGFIFDKITTDKKKFFCISYIIWGICALILSFVTSNILLTLIFTAVIGSMTGFTVITGVCYMSSNIPIKERALNAGIYIGIGWAVVSLTAYVSLIHWGLNIYLLSILNIIAGISSYILLESQKENVKWEQPLHIPRDYDVKKNGAIFWGSSVVFGTFLGIIVFLLGTTAWNTGQVSSFYLDNVRFYVEVVGYFNLGLVNFDFIIIGGMNVILSVIFGKLMDKYGRKIMFLGVNFLIPLVMIFFAFWRNFAFLGLSVLFYSMITAGFVVIDASAYSDLAPPNKMGQFNGLGWSALGIGGTIGFILAWVITSPGWLPFLDIMMIITVIGVSELSIIPFVSMKDSLPPSEEIEWSKEIIKLVVIKEGGVVMSNYDFVDDYKTDTDLFSGGISGIGMMLQEMIDSKQKLKIIDHQDKKLLFEFGELFSTVLIVKKDLKILRTKLEALRNEIQMIFHETIKTWSGDLEIFKPVESMIRNIFVEE